MCSTGQQISGYQCVITLSCVWQEPGLSSLTEKVSKCMFTSIIKTEGPESYNSLSLSRPLQTHYPKCWMLGVQQLFIPNLRGWWRHILFVLSPVYILILLGLSDHKNRKWFLINENMKEMVQLHLQSKV